MSSCDNHGHGWELTAKTDCECFYCEAKAVIVPATGTFLVTDGEVHPAAEEFGHGGRLWTIEVSG